MTHKEICTYEVCKLAKEKGFDIPTIGYYLIDTEDLCKTFVYNNWNDNTICYSAPTQSLLQRWLREEKGYYVYPFFCNEELKWTYVVREKTGDMWIPLIGETYYYDCFDEAMEDALKYVLEKLV